jgi:hypothetical protein
MLQWPWESVFSNARRDEAVLRDSLRPTLD